MKCNRVLKELNLLYLLYQQTPGSNELHQNEMVIQNKVGIKQKQDLPLALNPIIGNEYQEKAKALPLLHLQKYFRHTAA